MTPTVEATKVRERPILFSGEMVRALLDGRKTQTRRVVKRAWQLLPLENPDYRRKALAKCPYGKPGDRLWVRETLTRSGGFIQYAADTKTSRIPWPSPEWKQDPRPSIHMPRWASRLTLELTEVRVERVQGISEADARAEGITEDFPAHECNSARPFAEGYRWLWDSINAKRGYGWDVNPWVWVLSFNRVDDVSRSSTRREP